MQIKRVCVVVIRPNARQVSELHKLKRNKLDESRIHPILEFKPLILEKPIILVAKPHYKPMKVLLILFVHF